MFAKHFTEMLKSEMFQNLELGSCALLQNLVEVVPQVMVDTVGLLDKAVFSGLSLRI